MKWKQVDPATITDTTLPRGLTDEPWKEQSTVGGLIVVGTLLLLLAAEGQKLWYVLLWFSLGMVALAIALLYVNDWLDSQLVDEDGVPGEWWWQFGLLLGVGVLALGMSVVRDWPQWFAAVSVIAFTTGAIGLHVGVRRLGRPSPPPPTARWYRSVWWPAWAGAGVMLAASLVVGAVASFGVVTWLLLLVWLSGLIVLKGGVSPFLASRRARMWPVLVAMVVVTVVGGALVGVGLFTSVLAVTLPGVSVVIGALSVLGLALVGWEVPAGWEWGLLIGGAAGAVGGVFWATETLNVDGLGRVVGLFVFGVGTWYVFRGEGIVVALMIGWVAVWGLTDRYADAAADPNAGAEIEVLALGDSFMSGEGADEFLPGTNEAGGNECRRAPTAYAYLVAKASGSSLDFLACQGAKIDDLTRCGQMADAAPFDDGLLDPDRSNCTRDPATWSTLDRGGADDEIPGLVPQLAFFPEADYAAYHVILVSIGGNDAGFSALVKSCLLPSDCSDRAEVWNALARAQQPRLVELYTRLRAMAGEHTVIVAMPYPPIATGEDCQLGLSKDEHDFIDAHIAELGRVVESAAGEAGITFYGETATAYLGHDLCKGDDAGANHLLVETTNGSWDQRYRPGAWIHGSMHPNETGHLVLARELIDDVQTWAEEVRDLRAAGVPDDRPPGGVNPTGLPFDEDLAAEGRALVADGDWIDDELADSFWAMLGPLVLLLASGIVTAAGFVRMDTWLSKALRPRDPAQ